MILAPGNHILKYITIKRLGSGAFGNVYLMNDTVVDRLSAVKFVTNKDPSKFVEHYEAQIMNRLKHHRIVDVYCADVFSNGSGAAYAAISMEYISAGSADDALGRHISIRSAIRIIIDTLFALQHSHENNILHRDIKPANIMIQNGRAKLSDFGLATDVSPTLVASKAGTPIYWAPEVIKHGSTSVLTDLYSVGITLFQLLNNISDLSICGINWPDIERGLLIKKVGYKPYIPRRLRSICNKACNPDMNKRYTSAFKLRQSLESLRVAEDWTQVEDLHWECIVDDKRHEMQISNSNELIYTVNGRRKNAYCFKEASLEAAKLRMFEHIYNKTF